jgi:hypothetical protein
VDRDFSHKPKAPYLSGLAVPATPGLGARWKEGAGAKGRIGERAGADHMTQKVLGETRWKQIQSLPTVTTNFVKDYWIGCILIFLCLACWIVAALFFQRSDHAFIIASFLQAAGVFLALVLAYFFFEQRSQNRQKKIDKAIRRSTGELRGFASSVVIAITGNIYGKPLSHENYGPSNKEVSYQEARKITLERPSEDVGDMFNEFPSSRHFGELQWIFWRLEELATKCDQTIRLLGQGLIEYDGLLRSMVSFEGYVTHEQRVWEEFLVLKPVREQEFVSWEKIEKGFPGRFPEPLMAEALPSEAISNLLALSRVAVRLIDVLDSQNFEADQLYEAQKSFAPEILLRSSRWGAWKTKLTAGSYS